MKRGIVFLSAIFLFLCSLPVSAGILLDESNFPDKQFRSLLTKYDLDGDGLLIPDEFLAIKEIDCEKNEKIHDLTGIELFSELESLSCWKCTLNKLDVSSNTKLKYLDCCETGLGSLDLSANTQLHQLWAYGNRFAILDLSKCYYLSKAVKNRVADSSKNGGTACAYEDEETESYVVVDKKVSLRLADETIRPSEEENTTPSEQADSGMGGIASPSEGESFLIGSSVPLDIRPFGSVVINGISVSGICEIKMGNTVKYSRSISATGPVKDVFKPAGIGDYTMTVNLIYKLAGMQVDTSRHTRHFRVTAANPTPTPTPTATPVPVISPTPAVGSSTLTVGNLLYKMQGNKAIVIGPKSKSLSSINIPATVKINGKTCKVTEINKDAFKSMSKLTKATIGKNVISIDAQAFSDCTALKTLRLTKGLQILGDRAFYNCISLIKIDLPSSMKEIGKQAFFNCAKAVNIIIRTNKLTKKTVGANAFRNTPAKANVKVSKKKLKAYKNGVLKGIGKNVKWGKL